MADSSNDAAERINAIIERVTNLATLETEEASAFGDRAIRALDGLQVNYDVSRVEGGSVPPFVAPTIPSLPSIPDVPKFDDLLTSLDADTNIESRLESSLGMFLGTYFPASATDVGIQRLVTLAASAAGAITAAQSRVSGDTTARSHLNAQFSQADLAHTRVGTSMEAGNDGTSYLHSRFASGSAATAYLMTKFAQGDAATARLLDLMTNGGAGTLSSVESQVWQRDRGRILAETRKQRQTTVDAWAARGFPMPTGGARAALLRIDSEGQDRIAQSSRDRAIKDVDLMIENIKFAANLALQDASGTGRSLVDDASGAGRVLVDDARAATQLTIENARAAAVALLDDAATSIRVLVDSATRAAEPLVRLRSDAIQAAIEYMRAQAIGPQLKASLVKTQIDGRSVAARAIADYYTAQITASTALLNAEARLAEVQMNSQVSIADLTLKPSIVNAQIDAQLKGEQNRTVVAIADGKSRAAIGAAQLVSNIASSALTSLHASANLSQNS